MTQSDKTVRDGVVLVASYHFLLAIISLVAALAIFIFSIVPSFSGTASSSSIFMPVVGIVLGLFLTVFYGITGNGLIALKNSARMGAVFLALFGTIGGLFVLVGAGIPVVNTLLPDMAAVSGVIVGGLCGYALMTVLDLAVLTFLFNRRVRALFYGEPYTPERLGGSLVDRLRSPFTEDLEEEEEKPEPAPAPVKKAPLKSQVKPQTKTQVKTQTQRVVPVRRANPPEELDAPGDLFTEPTTRK
jgi:hypothetical protein